MDARLVHLLGSLIGARNRYVLARLEFALRHPQVAPPPTIGALGDASERSLREAWPIVEEQLDAALRYTNTLERSRSRTLALDLPFRSLRGTLREMDQYARAMRWVLTVTQRE